MRGRPVKHELDAEAKIELLISQENINEDQESPLPSGPPPNNNSSTNHEVAPFSHVHHASVQPIEDLVKDLDVSIVHGLSCAEVALRQRQYGRNILVVAEDVSIFQKFLSQFKDPLICLLLGSSGISLLLGLTADAMSIALAILIVVTVAFVQELSSEKSLAALAKLVPPSARVIRNKLVPGDVILLTVGDRIPADCRLLESVRLSVDESNLTGETHAVEKHHATCAHPSPNLSRSHHNSRTLADDRPNVVYMGTLVSTGHARALVIGTGRNSEFGAVFDVMQTVEERRTPLQHRMDTLGKHLSLASLGVISVIVFLGVLVQGQGLLSMFQIGVSLAVAAIPEGLPICVTVTLALGVMRMATKHAIVKKLPTVESLGCVQVICVDKTGTMTENQMTVVELVLPRDVVEISAAAAGGTKKLNSPPMMRIQISGTGYRVQEGVDRVTYRGVPVTLDENEDGSSSHRDIVQMIRVAALCCNATLDPETGTVLGLPTEGAIVALSLKIGFQKVSHRYSRMDEIPFTSEQKWMAISSRDNLTGVITWCMKGTVETIVPRCSQMQNHMGCYERFDAQAQASVLQVARDMAKKGLRVLAVAFGPEFMNDNNDHNMIFGGLVGILDPPRAGVDRAISRLRDSGIRTVMITGDAQETAVAIATKINILSREDCEGVLSGAQVDTMSLEDLSARVSTTSVFYRTCPRHKLKIVRAFQEAGCVVAMTGDGVNDAPALKASDIGIAMGTSTDVSKEAGDMILVDDNFATILCAIEEGKSIFYNILHFLRFQLSTSVAALVLVTLTTVLHLPNPLNAMQILWINLIMDGPPAQSLGVEPVDPDVMKEGPRDPAEPLITKRLVVRILVSSTIMVTGTLGIFVSELDVENLDDQGQVVVTRRAHTMSFTTFVLFDMFLALNCRSSTKSIWTIGWTSNRAFGLAISASLGGQFLVIYVPWFQSIFQTEALSFGDIVLLLLITSLVFVVDEVWKWHHRNRHSHSHHHHGLMSRFRSRSRHSKEQSLMV